MKFVAGMSGEFSGVAWRIVPGRKSADDLRLEIRTNGWIPINMALAFLQADFYAENEARLQAAGVIGRTAGIKPGERFINFCTGAQSLGWEVAVEQLEIERARKRAA